LLCHIFVAPKPLIEIEYLPRSVAAKIRMGGIDGAMSLHAEEKCIAQPVVVLEFDARQPDAPETHTGALDLGERRITGAAEVEDGDLVSVAAGDGQQIVFRMERQRFGIP